MAQHHMPRIVTSGMTFYLDPANRDCYIGSGTNMTDLTGNGFNATMQSGASFVSSNRLGAISLDGNTGSLTASPLVCPTGTGDFTIDIWFYLPVNLTYIGLFGLYAATLISSNTTNGIEAFIFSSSSSSTVPTTFRLGQYGAAPKVEVTGLNIPLLTWHNVCMTRSSGTGNIYFNGLNVGSGAGLSGVSYASASTSTYFGRANTTNYFGSMTGSLSSIRVYNRSLSSSEVSQNFNALRGRFGI